MATAPPRALELQVGAAAPVERSPVHESRDTQRVRWRGLILQLVARPPVSAGRHTHPTEHFERIGRCIELPLNVDLEVVAIVAVAAEHAPLEPRRLPVAGTPQGSGCVGDDVPARNGDGEIQLANAERVRPRHEIDVTRRLPDPRAPYEAQCGIESGVDAVERDEVVEEIDP